MSGHVTVSAAINSRLVAQAHSNRSVWHYTIQ